MSRCFFLGSATGRGFKSYFGQLLAPSGGCCILKGGPGTGKSTLMKGLAARLGPELGPIQEIHCASDADSLDAIIFEAYGLSVVDGTPPHTLEPTYPGACQEILNLGLWDAAALRARKQDIIQLSQDIDRRHAAARALLSGACSLLEERRRLAFAAVSGDKLRRYAASLSKLITPGNGAGEALRLASAVTNKGPILFESSLIAPKTYVLDDPCSAAAPAILGILRARAAALGQRAIVCPSPLFGEEQVDHLLLPDLGLAFITSGPLFPLEAPGLRRTHARRFMDVDALGKNRRRLQFLEKAAGSLVTEAASAMADAKTLHDDLEDIYRAAMDYAAVDAAAAALEQSFRHRAAQLPKAV